MGILKKKKTIYLQITLSHVLNQHIWAEKEWFWYFACKIQGL